MAKQPRNVSSMSSGSPESASAFAALANMVPATEKPAVAPEPAPEAEKPSRKRADKSGRRGNRQKGDARISASRAEEPKAIESAYVVEESPINEPVEAEVPENETDPRIAEMSALLKRVMDKGMFRPRSNGETPDSQKIQEVTMDYLSGKMMPGRFLDLAAEGKKSEMRKLMTEIDILLSEVNPEIYEERQENYRMHAERRLTKKNLEIGKMLDGITLDVKQGHDAKEIVKALDSIRRKAREAEVDFYSFNGDKSSGALAAFNGLGLRTSELRKELNARDAKIAADKARIDAEKAAKEAAKETTALEAAAAEDSSVDLDAGDLLVAEEDARPVTTFEPKESKKFVKGPREVKVDVRKKREPVPEPVLISEPKKSEKLGRKSALADILSPVDEKILEQKVEAPKVSEPAPRVAPTIESTQPATTPDDELEDAPTEEIDRKPITRELNREDDLETEEAEIKRRPTSEEIDDANIAALKENEVLGKPSALGAILLNAERDLAKSRESKKIEPAPVVSEPLPSAEPVVVKRKRRSVIETPEQIAKRKIREEKERIKQAEATANRPEEPIEQKAENREVDEPKKKKRTTKRVKKLGLTRKGPEAPETWKPTEAEIASVAANTVDAKTAERSFGERIREGLLTLVTRGKNRVETKSPIERVKDTYGKSALLAGALFAASRQFIRGKIPDVSGVLSSRLFSGAERQALKEAAALSMPMYEDLYASKEIAAERSREHIAELEKKVAASSLSDSGKVAFLSNLTALREKYAKEKGGEEYIAEIGKALDAAIPRLSGLQDGPRHAAELAGAAVLEGAKGTPSALVERYKTLTHDETGERASKGVRDAMVSAFKERMPKSLDARKSLRILAILFATGIPGNMLDSGDGSAIIDTILEKQEAMVSLNDPLPEAASTIASEEKTAESPQESVELASDALEGFTPEELEESRVREGDGITLALLRIMEKHPEKFGYESVDPTTLHVMAKREAISMARRDGLLKMWLKSEAVGNVYVVPVKKGSEWHVGFFNAKTEKELTDQERLALLTPEPKNAKQIKQP